MSMDACMFCGAAPCECPGRKKKAKPKAPARQKAPAAKPVEPAQAARPMARPVQNVEPPKKKAVPPVSQRNKIKPQSAPRSSRETDSENEEFWQAIRTLVAEDMLHPSEMQRVLAAYPRRPA